MKFEKRLISYFLSAIILISSLWVYPDLINPYYNGSKQDGEISISKPNPTSSYTLSSSNKTVFTAVKENAKTALITLSFDAIGDIVSLGFIRSSDRFLISSNINDLIRSILFPFHTHW